MFIDVLSATRFIGGVLPGPSLSFMYPSAHMLTYIRLTVGVWLPLTREAEARTLAEVRRWYREAEQCMALVDRWFKRVMRITINSQ